MIVDFIRLCLGLIVGAAFLGIVIILAVASFALHPLLGWLVICVDVIFAGFLIAIALEDVR